jgi:hypothetical protein
VQNCPVEGEPVAPTEGLDGTASAAQAAAAQQHLTVSPVQHKPPLHNIRTSAVSAFII